MRLLRMFILNTCRRLFFTTVLILFSSITHAQNIPDYTSAIDSVWGSGKPTSEKLFIFDNAMNVLNQRFTGFVGLDTDLDSLISHYRPEIASGVSKGRFVAIMNRISLLMQEGHTFLGEFPVNSFTPPAPGIPLLFVDGWGDNSHFGAALTPLPDNSLLVIRVVPNHPLGLVPGDIILGYEGIPWYRLYEELWEAELPIAFSFTISTSEEAILHSRLKAAGLNWHLFDTIDILKHQNGELQNLSTAPLATLNEPIWGTEILPVAGIQPLEYAAPFFGTPEKSVSWGIIDGTQVGYVQVGNWYNSAGAEFFNAIDSLMNHHQTSGLVLDYRLNYGGGSFSSFPGLELLFNETVETIGWEVRCNTTDRLALCPDPNRPTSQYVIQGDTNSFYDKPIAVLTGPGCVSGGEQNALFTTFHPNARLFGKPTTGAFSAANLFNIGSSDWLMIATTTNSWRASDPGVYLIREGLPVDEPVWFTPDDAANGFDTVLGAALDWINGTTSIDNSDAGEVLSTFELKQNYPNPFNPSTEIRYTLAKAGQTRLQIYNAIGQKVKSLVNEYQAAGSYVNSWNGTDEIGNPVVSGVYFYKLSSNEFTDISKMILLR